MTKQKLLEVTYMNLLKTSYLLGGIYDLLLGLGIIFLRSFILSLFKQKNPSIPVIADSLGLFLVAYGFLLLREAQKTHPNIEIGATSASVRIIYFVFVVYYILTSSIELLYVLLALTDLVSGLFIFVGIVTYKRAININ